MAIREKMWKTKHLDRMENNSVEFRNDIEGPRRSIGKEKLSIESGLAEYKKGLLIG